MPTETTSPQGNIPSEIGYLNDAITALLTNLTDLEQRLAPVMVATPAKESDQSRAVKAMSKYAACVNTEADRVINGAQRIAAILGHLDV